MPAPRSILRRVKPAIYSDDEEEALATPSGGFSPDGSEGEEDEDEEMEDYDDGKEHISDDEDASDPTTLLSSVSFGTLAKAASSLPSRQPRKAPAQPSNATSPPPPSSSRHPTKDSHLKFPKPAPAPKRTSKSAPTIQSSKRPVSRLRTVVDTPASFFSQSQSGSSTTRPNAPRDPRFDPAVAHPSTIAAVDRKHYAFLNQYRDDEMKALKDALGKTKDEREKERIKGVLKRMESRRQSDQAKEQQERLVGEHKKKEREKVAQGKKPFYLKKSDTKKLVLMDKYSKLGEKELDRVIEKKRKRKAAKERVNMPWARRT